MLGVFNVGGEGFDDGLVGIDVRRDTFSGGEGGNNGTARIVRFVGFGKEVRDGVRGLGLRRRDKSSLDKPWEGPAVVRKLDSLC